MIAFLGGPGFLPEEKRALVEVMLIHNSMPSARVDILNTGSLSYVISPFSSPLLHFAPPSPRKNRFLCAAVSFPLTLGLFIFKFSCPWTPCGSCTTPCQNREIMDKHNSNVYNEPDKLWVVEDWD